MALPIADAHVDVLMRMLEEELPFYPEYVVDSRPGSSPRALEAGKMQADFSLLRAGKVVTQVFALFVSPRQSEDSQLVSALREIDCFYQGVVKKGCVRAARTQKEVEFAHQAGEIAGILSIEGAGCLLGDPAILRMMYRLGVRGVGLTWNPANRLADGCQESRSGGLTEEGRRIVAEIGRLPMWIDLAHLGDQSISDVLSLHTGPIMASHANARSVYSHPRNLPDEVISEIISRRGWMGLVFQSAFLSSSVPSSFEDLARHIDHVIALGGGDSLGFGSDFDGGITPPVGLENASHYSELSDWLCARYGTEMAQKLLSDNFHNFLSRSLSESPLITTE